MRRHRPIMNAMKYGNPSVTQIAGPPAPARVAAWAPQSPYWQAGMMTAAALSAGAVPTCPPGSVPRAWGQNWYCAPSGYAAPTPPPQQFHPPFVGAGRPLGSMCLVKYDGTIICG